MSGGENDVNESIDALLESYYNSTQAVPISRRYDPRGTTRAHQQLRRHHQLELFDPLSGLAVIGTRRLRDKERQRLRRLKPKTPRSSRQHVRNATLELSKRIFERDFGVDWNTIGDCFEGIACRCPPGLHREKGSKVHDIMDDVGDPLYEDYVRQRRPSLS